MLKASSGKVNQNATIERIRFLAPDIALVDGMCTITSGLSRQGAAPYQKPWAGVGKEKEWPPAFRGHPRNGDLEG
jgi:hypothetical protein